MHRFASLHFSHIMATEDCLGLKSELLMTKYYRDSFFSLLNFSSAKDVKRCRGSEHCSFISSSVFVRLRLLCLCVNLWNCFCACAKTASWLVLPLSLFMCGNVVGGEGRGREGCREGCRGAQNNKRKKTEAGWRDGGWRERETVWKWEELLRCKTVFSWALVTRQGI